MQIGEVARPTAVAPFGTQHDEIERVLGLDLLPRLTPTARRVRRVEGFDHDAFMTGGERSIEMGLGLLDSRRS